MNVGTEFDVIVVGGGHAGVEAALAAARMGSKTLLLTQNIDTIGQMSCNPAIGGIGKSHLVSEVDAMGGVIGKAADRAGIHFRVLNSRKGPAVRATRAQADRSLYKKAIRECVESAENLSILQQTVEDLTVLNGVVSGVTTQLGLKINAKAVVLTVGTFLAGLMHVGQQQHSGGRLGDKASNRLAERLKALGLPVSRLKTGTPPRISAKTVDFSKMEVQHGDTPCPSLSSWCHEFQPNRQIPCFITHTTPETHQIIVDNLSKSAMYNGAIEGVGPRYCPSIEDKIVRFADKNQHQIFVEPEGLEVDELYPNGLSTSLPFDVQCDFIHSIPGFEQAHITRPGYAIEYDYFDPRALQYSLETKALENLYFAGQINGTTGYEEAAAQGLLAGINAALKVRGEPAWWPTRDQAYLGVLIDDLIRLGTQEPYRMFTSRAEYRLLLRQDNADARLTEKARELGLISDQIWAEFEYRQQAVQNGLSLLSKRWVQPGSSEAKALSAKLKKELVREYSLENLLKRPEITIEDIWPYLSAADVFSDLKFCEGTDWRAAPKITHLVKSQIEIRVKYQGYIDRQSVEVEKLRRQESTTIPADFDYHRVVGLSTEVLQKLQAETPLTLGQASRIPGVTPASISLLGIFLKKHEVATGVLNKPDLTSSCVS